MKPKHVDETREKPERYRRGKEVTQMTNFSFSGTAEVVVGILLALAIVTTILV